MANPSVTATVAVDDKASPKLRELMELTQRMSRLGKEMFKESGGDRYASGLRQATVAAQQHITVLEKLHKIQSAVAATVAGYAGAKAFGIAKHAFSDYVPYERDVRYQRAIQGFNDKEMAALERQRVNAATVYGVKPEETLHAQQAFVTRGFNAAVTEAATQQALILSRALAINGETASKIVEGITFGSGQHPHTAAEATRLMGRNIDMAALAAKAGAMSPEDISQFAKFGMGMTTAAGISAQQSYATAMTLKRANVGGDESGVFMRQMAARLLAPTKGAFDAFARMGIDYDQYAPQGSLSVDATEAAYKRRYGKDFGAAGRASLEEAFGDEKRNVLGNRGEFASAVREAIEASGEKLSKIDQKNVVSTALRQYDLAKGSLRGGALFDDIISKASPRDIQAIIGDKQGGRAVMLLNALDQYREYLEKLKGGDGYAEKIAQERMQGLAAAVDRLSASMDIASKQMVAANERWLTPMSDAAGKTVAAFTGLSDGTKGALSVASGLGAGAGVASAGSTVLSLIASFGNVTASANVAAAALAKVAGTGAVPGAVPPTNASKGAAALSGAASLLGWTALGVTGISLVAEGLDRIPSGGPRSSRGMRSRTDTATPSSSGRGIRTRSGRPMSGFWGETPVSTPSEAERRSDPFADRREATFEFLKNYARSEDASRGGWQDSARIIGPPPNGVGKWGEVTGTVQGTAELHQNVILELRPTAYFESLVKRAESVSTLNLNGRLGTSMQGPGDNGTKPSGGALTGSQ